MNALDTKGILIEIAFYLHLKGIRVFTDNLTFLSTI